MLEKIVGFVAKQRDDVVDHEKIGCALPLGKCSSLVESLDSRTKMMGGLGSAGVGLDQGAPNDLDVTIDTVEVFERTDQTLRECCLACA